MSERILIIDDDPAVHEVSGACLERDGYIVSSATEGETGLALSAARTPSLVILDLGLPDMPGESVLREIRRRSRMPIIVLSAKGETEERVTGLRLGADDYLSKPYSARELVARVKALLRRASGEAMGLDLLSFDGGALEIDLARHEVRADGEPRDLTPTEFDLLMLLAQYPGRVYSRGQIASRLRGQTFAGDERVIDVHVRNLRQKIEADPTDPRRVGTVRGVGYRLGVEPS